jgi:hypothetical protein
VPARTPTLAEQFQAAMQNILFDYDKSTINSSEIPKLQSAAAWLLHNPSVRLLSRAMKTNGATGVQYRRCESRENFQKSPILLGAPLIRTILGHRQWRQCFHPTERV